MAKKTKKDDGDTQPRLMDQELLAVYTDAKDRATQEIEFRVGLNEEARKATELKIEILKTELKNEQRHFGKLVAAHDVLMQILTTRA